VNKKFKLGAAGLVTAALAALAIVTPGAAYADSSVAPVVGSGTGQTDEALYVLDNETGEPFAAGASLSYGLSIVGGPSATDPVATFSAPAGGAQFAFTFISPRGQERDYNAWNAMSNIGSGTEQSLVAIGPSAQATTGTGTPAGTAAVAAAGGDYSLGVAWVSNNVVLKTAFTYISVVSGNIATTTFTFAQPAVAPTITTTALNALTTGAAFTQTIAATGTTPIAWSVKSGSGSLPAGLTLDSATGTISGTPTTAGAYSFTLTASNNGGSDDQAFSGRVAAPAPTSPIEPTTGNITISDPAKGATTITIPAGAANASKTFDVWAWSTPTKLGQATTDANGNATVDISALPAGAHKVALVLPGDATYAVQAWVSFTKPTNTGDTLTQDVSLTAAVTASDLWSLAAQKTNVDFGNVARGATSVKKLGTVTVIDDRNVLKGWDLNATWQDFTGAQNIGKSVLTVTPALASGYAGKTGISVSTAAGTSGAKKIAEGIAGVSTTTTGALFDADLAFAAPVDAAAGVYSSTLTLTLTSK